MKPADGSQIIAIDQQKKMVKEVVKEASLVIMDARISITLLIIDVSELNLLFETDWMRRYDAELSFKKKTLSFEAKG